MSSYTLARTPVTPAAHFGTVYGYRFNGDNVELHASFHLLNDTAHELRWTLQLRASPVASTETDPFATHLVAEVSLPPISEFAATNEPFYLTAIAKPPAGNCEFNMTLVLVAKNSGLADEVHDVAIFARPERFALPRFTGEIGYQLATDNIRLNVGAVENPRDPANLSGTLSLELWALAAPYDGGFFQGTSLAGTLIGHLAGQQSWHALSYDLPFTPPPVGRWHLVLMLREWTDAGYTTRDYLNFTRPFVIEAEPQAKPVAKASAIIPRLESPAPAKPAPTPKAAIKTPTAPTKVARTAATGVSVNHASPSEFAAIKGITKTAVTAIIAGRPYTSLDQLAKVKGVGTKTLAKIRASLAL